jgi:hypothetical protein
MREREPWFSALTDEEIWMLYNLVTGRVEAFDKAELEAMSNLGGQTWRELQKKLRRAVDSQSRKGDA